MITWFTKVAVLVLLLSATAIRAELKPIGDDELGNYSGQAAVAFDVNEVGTDTFTKVTIGMQANLQMNIDSLEAGTYSRSGETLSSDIDIDKLGFGSISTDASQIQLDGNTYAVNEIVPFELSDPYIEIAQNDTDDLTGFRIGFGGARGQLSGDFNSITGNVGIGITDFFGDYYQAELLDINGNVDNVRAQYFGVSDTLTGGATNCSTGFYCYDLADYKTLDVGEINSTTGGVDPTKDFFISFQKEDVEWQTSTGSMTASSGAFINIPTSINIDMNRGINANGIDRVRTEYINRGNDLF